ncbi:MAG: AAA family ATPase [Microbacterium sp.]|uniref:AAA family ATPase n=1 Tax=Microbacterium sp. TaxID=51671 RepID=UPI003BB21D5B
MPIPNPFKPTAGASPPQLVGRQSVIDDFAESLDDGPGAPSRLMRLTGARGTGKTVMLTATAEEAAGRGWLVVSDTVVTDVTARLTKSVRRALSAQGQIETDGEDFRYTMEVALDELEQQGLGLLITLDEVHTAGLEQMKEITVAMQHLQRDGRNIAFVFAGLPSPIAELLNDKVLTFLRRAEPVELRDVPLPSVQSAFLETITENGRTITDNALAQITVATGGYPFMIQLVGYHVWRVSREGLITSEDAELGIPAARKRLGAMVHSTALRDASAVDRTFLLAMSLDDGPSKISDIRERMHAGSGYASMYRQRLLNVGLINAPAHGYVEFALPYMRDFLREDITYSEMADRMRHGEDPGINDDEDE